MRLLLDENLPARLKRNFPEHEIYTARDKGWNGIKNGDLLKFMIDNEFDALITFDKNLQHQQNFSTHRISVILLLARINKYAELVNLVPSIKESLSQLRPGVIVIQEK